jgi:hypothetical protein
VWRSAEALRSVGHRPGQGAQPTTSPKSWRS